MCLHSRTALKEALLGHAHNMSTEFAVIWYESPDGKQVKGIDCVRANDDVTIRRYITNLNKWHPDELEGWTLRLEHLNLKRWMVGLPAFDPAAPALAEAS